MRVQLKRESCVGGERVSVEMGQAKGNIGWWNSSAEIVDRTPQDCGLIIELSGELLLLGGEEYLGWESVVWI